MSLIKFVNFCQQLNVKNEIIIKKNIPNKLTSQFTLEPHYNIGVGNLIPIVKLAIYMIIIIDRL